MRALSVLVVAVLVSVATATYVVSPDPCADHMTAVKSAQRTANAWRATCEDANWKGAGCYNYWAQNDELMNLENQLQDCRQDVQATFSGFLLGSRGTPGHHSADGQQTRSSVNTNAATTKAAAVSAEEGNRNVLTPQFKRALDSLLSTDNTEWNNTQTTSATETAKTLAALSSTTKTLSTLHTKKTNDELILEQSSANGERSLVASSNNATKAAVTTQDQMAGDNVRGTTSAEEASTRTTEVADSTATRTVINQEAAAVNNLFTTQTTSTRATVANEEQTNRDATTADATSTKDAATDEFNKYATMFAGLQLLLQDSYGQETAAMQQMWGTVLDITAHLDLRPYPSYWSWSDLRNPFGNTNVFRTPESAGGKISTIRALCLEAITVNKQLYNRKVGYADTYFASAEAYYAAGKYSSAAERYRAAYAEAVTSRL